jgi:ATP-dependent DNA ligase
MSVKRARLSAGYVSKASSRNGGTRATNRGSGVGRGSRLSSIGGRSSWSAGSSRTPNGFESLLVGYYEGRKLMFASKVRVGLTSHIRAELFPVLKSFLQSKCPFANLPSSKTGHWGEGITAEDMTALRWVKPKIVVEVSFVEWTRDGLLRHPEFFGVRGDKSPREIRRQEG